MLTLSPNRGGIDLAATLGCGQVFQWYSDGAGGWRGIVDGAPVRARQEGGALVCDSPLPAGRIRAYFRLDDNLEAIYASFPDDAQQAVAAFRGMRLVQQDLWECLLSFVCATNANIPRIHKMIAALCRRYGDEAEKELYSFPTAASLAAANEGDLRALGLGYRAAHLLAMARRVDGGLFDLSELTRMDYASAHARLQALPGVGPKVADCVCLFSLGHLRAVPVDTWVRRMVQRRAPGLRSYRAMAEFAQAWLGPYAGYAQQYLFHYERTQAGWGCGGQ